MGLILLIRLQLNCFVATLTCTLFSTQLCTMARS